MSSKGDCDRERDRRRSSVVPHGATSSTADSTHDIEPRRTEDFSHSPGLAVSPLYRDVRTSIGATAVSNIAATASSSPDYLQVQRRAMIRAHFLSPTPPAGSTEQHTAPSNTATIAPASEETNEELVPLGERLPSWSSLFLAVGVKHAELSTIKNCARPSLLSTADSQHVATVSSGINSDSWLTWQSLSLVHLFQRAERSIVAGGPSSSLTVGTQHVFPSFVHKPIDGPRDATLAVDEGQPTAIGPRTRSQT